MSDTGELKKKEHNTDQEPYSVKTPAIEVTQIVTQYASSFFELEILPIPAQTHTALQIPTDSNKLLQ